MEISASPLCSKISITIHVNTSIYKLKFTIWTSDNHQCLLVFQNKSAYEVSGVAKKVEW